MITLTKETTLVGTSELRKEIPKLTTFLKGKTVVVMKRGKPVAVLQDFEEYETKEGLLEAFEDMILGYLAKQRDSKTKKEKYIPLEKAAKSYGISL